MRASGALARRRLLLALAAAGLGFAQGAAAQGRVPRIGYLVPFQRTEPPTPERLSFLAGLKELGYEEGRNIHIEYRFAQNDAELLERLAAELVAMPVELIVVGGHEAAVAARMASKTIPIVLTSAGDPVITGLAQSYARPGGNVTGMTFIAPELGGKRLGLIREVLPNARRVAVYHSGEKVALLELEAVKAAARLLEVEIEPHPILKIEDILGALEALERTRPDALMVIVDTLFVGLRKIIADAALKARVPCFAGWREYAVSGAMISYAPHFRELFRRSARYVDRILRGAKPAEMPIEQPTRFELVINRRTARAIGVRVPQTVLLRADELLE